MEAPKSKILVVDDEPNVLLTVQAILEREGYDVDALHDPAAALQAIRTRQYDLVLTDLKMPGVDGLAVLAEVRKSSPSTVTVMMTGYGSVDSALEALQLGAYEYLMKPTEVAELKLAVKRSLERKRLSEIDTLYTVGRTISSSLDPNSIVDEVSSAARRVLHVAQASLLTLSGDLTGNPGLDPSTTELYRLMADPEVLTRLTRGVIITSADALPAAESWAIPAGVRSYCLVPGVSQGCLGCVLCAHNGEKEYDFHASAQRFLSALATQTAMALQNATLVAELRRNNQDLEGANTALRELDRLKSQFLSVATHELRTPLTVILGYNSMLAESLQDRLNTEEQDTLREAVEACRRLIRLVNSMLDISQIESGGMRMKFTRADLPQIISGTVTLFQHDVRARGLTLKVDVPSRLPRMLMDAERIHQVLINLVGNALKFTPQGGTITVSLQYAAEAQEVRMTVADSGIGIAPRDQALIFDEFAQIRRQNELRHREGAGLGLAISKRIVQAHDGRIEVSSRLGYGSTFTVILPVKRRQPLQSAVSA
jgi:signal transduction histidine kinase/DNA-binding response OmpR family regulator